MPDQMWGATLTLYRYWHPVPIGPALATVLAEWHDDHGPRWASCLLHHDPAGPYWILWNPRYFTSMPPALGDLKQRDPATPS